MFIIHLHLWRTYYIPRLSSIHCVYICEQDELSAFIECIFLWGGADRLLKKMISWKEMPWRGQIYRHFDWYESLFLHLSQRLWIPQSCSKVWQVPGRIQRRTQGCLCGLAKHMITWDPNCDLMLYCHYTDILHHLSLNLWFVKEVQWNLGACNVLHHFIFTLHVEPLSTEFWWVHDAWSSRLKQVQSRCVRSMTGGGCEGNRFLIANGL